MDGPFSGLNNDGVICRYMYIYKERDTHTHTHTHIYTYICMYIASLHLTNHYHVKETKKKKR